MVARIDDCPARKVSFTALVRGGGAGRTVAIQVYRAGEATRTVIMVEVEQKPETL